MANCTEFKNMLPAALYNELTAEEMEQFEAHKLSCSRCEEEYRSALTLVDGISKTEFNELGEEYWDGYWDKLEQKIDAPVIKESPVIKVLDTIRHKIAFNPKLVYLPVAASLILFAGITLGRGISSPTVDHIVYTAEENRVLEDQIVNYLNTSKVLISSLVNFDAARNDIYGLDLPTQKKISENLLTEAENIRAGLAFQRRDQLLRLVLDLQLVLLNIAKMDGESGYDEIEILQNSIKQSALLLKIRLEEIHMTKKIYQESEEI